MTSAPTWRSIGGGIVGVTTALLLHEAGVHVVLLEADRIGHGVTGHTTAKVSSQHGLMYSRLRSKHGAEAARALRRGERAGAGLDRRPRPARRRSTATSGAARRYVYSSERSDIEDEADAAVEAGLPAALVEQTPLPYPVAAAVRFDRQAEFHAHKYLLALAAAAARGLRAHARRAGRRRRAHPGRRACAAEHTIVATHFPFPDRSLAFARVHPQRSYALACRIAGAPPEGMFISGDCADAQRPRGARRATRSC